VGKKIQVKKLVDGCGLFFFLLFVTSQRSEGKTEKRIEGERETRSEEKTEKQNCSRLCFQRNATNELSLLQSGHFEKRII
jgi:hypothetical protein